MKKAGNSNCMLLNTGMTNVLFWESMPIKKHSVTQLPKCTQALGFCANSLSNHNEQTGIQMTVTQSLLVIYPKLEQICNTDRIWFVCSKRLWAAL